MARKLKGKTRKNKGVAYRAKMKRERKLSLGKKSKASSRRRALARKPKQEAYVAKEYESTLGEHVPSTDGGPADPTDFSMEPGPSEEPR